MAYDLYPSVDEGYNFPPEVRQSMAASPEVRAVVTNTMGDVVDDLVSDAISNDGTIRQAAIDAVGPAIADMNAVRAYPEEPILQTTLSSVPIYWTYKVLNDPYVNNYTDTYDGTWSGDTLREGNIPIVREDGTLYPSVIPKLSSEHMPSAYATTDEVNQRLRAYDKYAVDIAELSQEMERKVSNLLPIFGARLAVAKNASAPIAVVYTGSSTTAARPGYISELTDNLQKTYVVPDQSTFQWNFNAVFEKQTAPGLHAYSAGHGGTTSADYLTDAECSLIADLDPALVTHMVGSNDYRARMSISDYKANMLSRLEYLDSVLPSLTQHVLIQAYQRMDGDREIPWDDYGLALLEIASERDNTTFVDLSESYKPVGIPGTDPLGLLASDNVHQARPGYEFMADLLTGYFIA